jgi:hypothetical protein
MKICAWHGAGVALVSVPRSTVFGFEVAWVAQGMRVVKSGRNGTRSDKARWQSLSGASGARNNYD